MAVITLGQLPVDFSSVKNTLIVAWKWTKDCGIWLGHSIALLSAKGWEMGKIGLQKLVEVILVIWKGCLPYILKVAAILASKPGILAIGVLASVLILRMALNDNNLTDRTSRIALGIIALATSFFFGGYAVAEPSLL
jgi:hypothetical protein